MAQPKLTTPITTNSNLDEQTLPLETTPLLQHTRSFYSDILAERGDTQSIERQASFSPPAPPAASPSPTEPSDEPPDTDPGRPLVRDKAWLGSKFGLASWVRAVSLTLENSGSVARDHLASERTFLAYVRTSLSIASAGVALAQILSFTERSSSEEGKRSRYIESYARPLGGIAVILSMVVLGMGVYRYFSIQRALVKGVFPVSRVGVAVLALLLGTLVAMTFGVLLVGRLKER